MQPVLQPDVTIVIPAYNGASFIREAVESCLGQASDGFIVDVVVVDDNSADQTRDIVLEFPRNVRLIRHQTNQGRHVARNVGLEAATGTYVKFLDQDDYLEPNTLRSENELAIAANSDIVIAGHRTISRDGQQWKVIHERQSPRSMEPRIQAILDGCAVPTAAALYKRSYIAGLKWDGDVPRLDDWDWFVRAALRMGTITPIHHVSYSWRQHPQQYTRSSTLNQYARDHHRILNKIEQWLRDNNQFTAPHKSRLAQYYYKMLRTIYKHDPAWYRKTLAHIFDLDASFQPCCEPRSPVRWLCRIVGVRAGLFLYNHVADAVVGMQTLIRKRHAFTPSFGRLLPVHGRQPERQVSK